MIKYLSIFVFIFIAYSCKRYEEGPNFTLRSVTQRISGHWEITCYEIEGVDSLAYQDFYCTEFYFGGSGDRNCNRYVRPAEECILYPNQVNWPTWHLSPDKEYLSLGENFEESPFTIFYTHINSNNDTSTQYIDSWKILQLTNHEMILDCWICDDLSLSNRTIYLSKIDNNPCYE